MAGRIGYNRTLGTPEVQFHHSYAQKMYFEYAFYALGAQVPVPNIPMELKPFERMTGWTGLATRFGENFDLCVVIGHIRFGTNSGPYY